MTAEGRCSSIGLLTTAAQFRAGTADVPPTRSARPRHRRTVLAPHLGVVSEDADVGGAESECLRAWVVLLVGPAGPRPTCPAVRCSGTHTMAAIWESVNAVRFARVGDEPSWQPNFVVMN